MKRLMAALLLILLMFSLVSCAEKESPAPVQQQPAPAQAPTPTPEPTPEPEPEPEPEKVPSNEIVLGEPLVIGDYEVVLHSFERVSTWGEDEEAIKIVYGWKNNSDSESWAIMAVNITGYQNGVELEGSPLSDDIDLGIGQKNVQPGFGQDNCETGIIIEGEGPIEIRVSELFSFDNKYFTITIDPDNL